MKNKTVNISSKSVAYKLSCMRNQLYARIKSISNSYLKNLFMELSWDQVGTKFKLFWHQVGAKLASGWRQVIKILDITKNAQPIQAIMDRVQWTSRTKFRNKYINLFLELELIQMTIPDKPNSSKQQYVLTEKGNVFLKLLESE